MTKPIHLDPNVHGDFLGISPPSLSRTVGPTCSRHIILPLSPLFRLSEDLKARQQVLHPTIFQGEILFLTAPAMPRSLLVPAHPLFLVFCFPEVQSWRRIFSPACRSSRFIWREPPCFLHVSPFPPFSPSLDRRVGSHLFTAGLFFFFPNLIDLFFQVS